LGESRLFVGELTHFLDIVAVPLVCQELQCIWATAEQVGPAQPEKPSKARELIEQLEVRTHHGFPGLLPSWLFKDHLVLGCLIGLASGDPHLKAKNFYRMPSPSSLKNMGSRASLR